MGRVPYGRYRESVRYDRGSEVVLVGMLTLRMSRPGKTGKRGGGEEDAWRYHLDEKLAAVERGKFG